MKRVRANHHGVKLEKSVSITLFGREILRGTWLSVTNNVTYEKGGLYE